ncbi:MULTISPECIES: photosystem I reaction center subunit III, PsaF [Cyanophyceae]|uniref:photosystem I reaction center subunit III, PsaF n=1 Tax=Cyanophyceae TaxID=3028117 RepID=UPI00016DC5BE|nr:MULTISPECIES: photosystem I reaction center subunit III, PsaF [Cyanophyceae]ACA99011.1 photosystem I reaction center subunit III, PsaF [Picosynechococcus sp. PCC 7002]SMH35805.1 photosystem I subunit 3 [Picosynechococcus sp. OG1]SMQ84867.1 photosystem I subunit 3 [Synechococcus sp. 7002]
MQRFVAVVCAFALSLTLWLGFASPVKADSLSHLTPCSESAAYKQRAKNFRNTTADPNSGQNRAAAYSEALCGPEGLPHLIVDGRLDHAGEFLIPSLLFLYIAGWIGWAGRAYLIAVRDEKDAAMQEVIINVPRAFSLMLAGFAWPLAALKEFTSGELVVKDADVPISPR